MQRENNLQRFILSVTHITVTNRIQLAEGGHILKSDTLLTLVAEIGYKYFINKFVNPFIKYCKCRPKAGS